MRERNAGTFMKRAYTNLSAQPLLAFAAPVCWSVSCLSRQPVTSTRTAGRWRLATAVKRWWRVGNVPGGIQVKGKVVCVWYGANRAYAAKCLKCRRVYAQWWRKAAAPCRGWQAGSHGKPRSAGTRIYEAVQRRLQRRAWRAAGQAPQARVHRGREHNAGIHQPASTQRNGRSTAQKGKGKGGEVGARRTITRFNQKPISNWGTVVENGQQL